MLTLSQCIVVVLLCALCVCQVYMSKIYASGITGKWSSRDEVMDFKSFALPDCRGKEQASFLPASFPRLRTSGYRLSIPIRPCLEAPLFVGCTCRTPCFILAENLYRLNLSWLNAHNTLPILWLLSIRIMKVISQLMNGVCVGYCRKHGALVYICFPSSSPAGRVRIE